MAKKSAVKKPQELKEASFDFSKYHFDIDQKFKLTKKQLKILKTCQNPDTRMIILDGPAGVSKTYVAMLIALEKLRDKKVNGITALRSSVISADSEIGFLAGTIDDKMKYFANPFGQKLKELLKNSDVEVISKKLLDVLPVSFLRSYSFTNECLILSESQNVMNESLFLCASSIRTILAKKAVLRDSVKCSMIKNLEIMEFIILNLELKILLEANL